jgi:hypothetical protein
MALLSRASFLPLFPAWNTRSTIPMNCRAGLRSVKQTDSDRSFPLRCARPPRHPLRRIPRTLPAPYRYRKTPA